MGLVALVTVVATEAMAVATVMPLVESDLGDLALYGWVFSAFQMGTVVGIVVGGRRADDVSPAQPLLLGLALFCAGLVVAGTAPSMPVVVVGRALQGFGAGAVPTVAYTCVGRGFPPQRRPRVFAVMSSAWVLPSLVSPLVASWVARTVGWRWVFLGLVPVAVVAGLVGAAAVAPLVPDRVAGRDRGGSGVITVLRLVAGAAALVAGLTSSQWWATAVLVPAGLLLGVPAFVELTPRGTTRLRPRQPAAVGLRGMLTFAFFASDAFVALALTSVRGRSTLFAGVVLGLAALTWASGAWVQARLAASHGPVRLVRTGGVLIAAAVGVYAVGLLPGAPLALWPVGSLLSGLGMGLAYPQLSVVTLGEAEAGREGRAATALQLSDVLGVALGTGVAGAIVAWGDRLVGTNGPALAVVFATSAAVAVAVAVLSSRLGDPPAGQTVRAATRSSRRP